MKKRLWVLFVTTSVGMHLIAFSLFGSQLNCCIKDKTRHYLAVRVVSLPPPSKLDVSMSFVSSSTVYERSVAVDLSKAMKELLKPKIEAVLNPQVPSKTDVKHFVATIPKPKKKVIKRLCVKAVLKPIPKRFVGITRRFSARVSYKRKHKAKSTVKVKRKAATKKKISVEPKESIVAPKKYVSREPSRAGGKVTKPCVDEKPRTVSIERLSFVKKVVPKYPFVARQLGYEGVVKVSFMVSRSGTVYSVKILKSSGKKILDKAAVSAVSKWRFRPVLRDVRVITDIVFRLRD